MNVAPVPHMKLAPRHRERLERLADLLENLDDPKVKARLGIRMKNRRVKRFEELSFDMHTWFDPPREEDERCGTTACAAGFAALDPWFQKQGLKIDDAGPAPKFSRYENGLQSLSRFFFGKDAVEYVPYGTEDDPAAWLFLPRYYRSEHPVTPTDVAKRVRQILAEAI